MIRIIERCQPKIKREVFDFATKIFMPNDELEDVLCENKGQRSWAEMRIQELVKEFEELKEETGMRYREFVGEMCKRFKIDIRKLPLPKVENMALMEQKLQRLPNHLQIRALKIKMF